MELRIGKTFAEDEQTFTNQTFFFFSFLFHFSLFFVLVFVWIVSWEKLLGFNVVLVVVYWLELLWRLWTTEGQKRGRFTLLKLRNTVEVIQLGWYTVPRPARLWSQCFKIIVGPARSIRDRDRHPNLSMLLPCTPRLFIYIRFPTWEVLRVFSNRMISWNFIRGFHFALHCKLPFNVLRQNPTRDSLLTK